MTERQGPQKKSAIARRGLDEEKTCEKGEKKRIITSRGRTQKKRVREREKGRNGQSKSAQAQGGQRTKDKGREKTKGQRKRKERAPDDKGTRKAYRGRILRSVSRAAVRVRKRPSSSAATRAGSRARGRRGGRNGKRRRAADEPMGGGRKARDERWWKEIGEEVYAPERRHVEGRAPSRERRRGARRGASKHRDGEQTRVPEKGANPHRSRREGDRGS